ncbi:MAG: preprotein translocase subunit SecG [Cytophagaceae bacterium]|jgi:preprotein translocase subunit SecG|nr:preprotein translocase subunit SecG [Cytophagaceae bacterium]
MIGIILGVLILVAVLLILIVMIQNPKGGGIAAGMGASSANQFLGVKKTGDLLENATWGLAVAIFVLSFSTSMVSKSVAEEEGEVEDEDLPKSSVTAPDTTQSASPDTTKY